jgi:hypothetical protein
MNTREYTFPNLFGSPFDFEGTEITLNKIEIPKIQRDYAQGRPAAEVVRIRNRFLDALFKSITDNEHLTLDFVYGDVSKDGILTPLDGQQRLTTLFLLHWYIAKKEEVDVTECEFLNYFSYDTRFNARDFCSELVKYSPDFSENKLSEWITDQSWYPYEWKNDPTIQSMLVMLDAIHDKFKKQEKLWQSLVINGNVSFYFLPLTDMGLTDDLYIKMNSRGKPLTQFEHFKAEFEEIIKQHSEELSKEINCKFDINWADLLFPFRGDNNIIDDEFLRYFRFVSDIICYQSGVQSEQDEFKVAELLYGKQNERVLENLEYLIASFDCWCEIPIADFFNKFFSIDTYISSKVNLYQDNLNIFKECCDNYGDFSGRNRKFPLNKTLLLFAINTYLLNKDKVLEDDFRRRIRIIRNLIWNSQFEIREERMQRLLTEVAIIITEGYVPISEEERNKIEWLKSNPQMVDKLFLLEDHRVLKGCVAIVGLDNSDNFTKFKLLFDNCNKDLINRALLTLGDYSQQDSWRVQRVQIGVNSRSQEKVWSDLFHPTKQRQRFEFTSQILNQLLSHLNESGINDNTLKQLIDEYLNDAGTLKDWKYYFVKYDTMRIGSYGKYYWKNISKEQNPYEIIMMNTETNLNGKNWDVFLYTLYHFSDFEGKLSLGNYAYSGDKLKIIGTDIEIDCLNDKFITLQNNAIINEYPIPQSEDGIDIEDRIEFAKQIIRKLAIQ